MTQMHQGPYHDLGQQNQVAALQGPAGQVHHSQTYGVLKRSRSVAETEPTAQTTQQEWPRNDARRNRPCQGYQFEDIRPISEGGSIQRELGALGCERPCLLREPCWKVQGSISNCVN
ncbi:hypothetical protein Pyn_16984 [Prunus yedoensis var. nudiflora]|uniref:Uncharacterized protein n=1 Tax=Prunus yedoensis var. nudiflora TaxID=2094558 RepID=A0A314Z5B5_PRUYE|nr:hypothetical protein Pyn_16984 [Prunus yedoensis var. nudiflora]